MSEVIFAKLTKEIAERTETCYECYLLIREKEWCIGYEFKSGKYYFCEHCANEGMIRVCEGVIDR